MMNWVLRLPHWALAAAVTCATLAGGRVDAQVDQPPPVQPPAGGCLDIGAEFQGPLTPGNPVTLCIQALGPVPPDEALLLELGPQSPADADAGSILYVKWSPGVITRFDYDAISAMPFAAHQRLVLPTTLLQGQLQVLLEGAVFPNPQHLVRFRADVLPVALADVPLSPQAAANRGTVTATIRGAGFTPAARFFLEPPGGAEGIGGEPPLLRGSDRAEVVFSVAGRPPGLYDLRVEKGGGPPFVVPGAFELLPAGTGSALEVALEGRESYRRGRVRQIYLMYRNVGDEEMPAPSLTVQVFGPSEARLRAHELGEFSLTELEVTAEDPDKSGGVLLPGPEWVRVPVVFRAELPGHASFDVVHVESGEIVAALDATIVAAHDPNEKEGPAGTGDGGDLMPAGADFNYAIHFENVAREGQPDTTAPVQSAVVVDALDGFLDFPTLQFTDVTVGTRAPVDLRGALLWFADTTHTRGEISRITSVENASGSFRVRVTAAIDIDEVADPPHATVSWEFETLGDPGDVEGFLPTTRAVDDGTALEGQSEGSVAFNILALEPMERETVIDNDAMIFFDEEAGVATSRIRRRILLAPDGPSAPEPPDRVDITAAPTSLAWASSAGATSYLVEVWEDDGETPLLSTATTDPSFEVGTLRGEVVYRWRVTARNALHTTQGPVWRFRTPSAVRFVRGDVDASASIDLTDAVVLLDFLFLGGTRPTCLDAADADDTDLEFPTLTDAVFILGWLFRGDAPPPPPSPLEASFDTSGCGLDPTPDAIGCEAFAPCGL